MSAETSPEAELLMAVYARFGLAMHYCAMIEWDVLTLITATRMKTGGAIALEEVTSILDGAYKDALDRLAAELEADVDAPHVFALELHGAFEIRRRMVTGWFRQHALELLDDAGRVRALKELNSACGLLQTVHDRVRGLLDAVARKHGLAKDAIVRQLRGRMGIDPAPAS